MTHVVLLTPEAAADLERLYDFVLQQELDRGDDGNLDRAQEALTTISLALTSLERLAFTCRKAGPSPFVRELVISFGHTGYVALFEIIDDKTVVVAAVRHQREEDYH